MSPRLWRRIAVVLTLSALAVFGLATPAAAAVIPQAVYPLPSGTQPWSVATARDGSVWVSDPPNDRVFHLSSSGAILATIPVGAIPYDIALTPDNQNLYVASYLADTVSVIDTSSELVVSTIALASGAGPIGVTVSPRGDTVYVTGYGNRTLIKIDVASGSPTTYPVAGEDQTLALSPDGSKVYLPDYSSGNIEVRSTSDGSLLATLAGVCPHSYNMVIASLTHRIFATCYDSSGDWIAVIDTSTNSLVTTLNLGIGSNSRFLDVSPDESALAVTFQQSSELKLFDTSNYSLLQSVSIPSGTPSTITNGVKFAPDGASLWAALDSAESMWKLTVDPPLPRPTATPALASTGTNAAPIFIGAGILVVLGAAAFAYAAVLRTRRND